MGLLRSKGVQVTNAAGVLGPAVAETAIALLLQVARRTLEGYKAILEYVRTKIIIICQAGLINSLVSTYLDNNI